MRAAGEGSVYKTADGRWRGAMVFGWKDGKPIRRGVNRRTRAEAAAALRKLQNDRAQGLDLQAAHMTVQQWLTYWLETVAPRRCKPQTLDSYGSLLNVWVYPTIGAIRLQQLTPEDVERFHATMKAGGFSQGSARYGHAVLSRGLKVAWQRGHILRNPAALVDAPPIGHTAEVEPLTPEEARAVLAAAAGDRLAARWSLALAIGLRQGEALGLAWDYVDLDRGEVRVHRTVHAQTWRHGCGTTPCDAARPRSCPSRRDGGLVCAPVKSRAGERTITLPASIVTQLRAHRSAQLRERLQEGPRWSSWRTRDLDGTVRDIDLVFAQRSGQPLHAKADNQAWKALLVRAGVRVIERKGVTTTSVRLHDARHTAASLMIAAGEHPRTVMEVLGHSTINVTMNIYGHLFPHVRQQAADRMNETLWGVG